MNGIIIKDMHSPEERNGKSYVHYKSWHETYAGLVDESYLKNITHEKCCEITEKWPGNVIVAKYDDKVVGFVGYGPYRHDSLPGYGEIYSLYVLADFHGMGVGTALLNAALDRLSDCAKVALWVLADNDKAVGFYKKYGFRFDGKEQEIVLGTVKKECRMFFERGDTDGNT